jgi:hypothetical protein
MAAGRLPISLLRWEITGRDDEIQRLRDHRPLDDVLAGGNAERSDQR